MNWKIKYKCMFWVTVTKNKSVAYEFEHQDVSTLPRMRAFSWFHHSCYEECVRLTEASGTEKFMHNLLFPPDNKINISQLMTLGL